MITSVAPSLGRHNTEITIEGTSLRGAGDNVAKVTLAGVEATIVDETDGTVTVVAQPSDAASGDVVLTSSTGSTVTANGGVDYVAAASIDSISPANGQVGTKATITGSSRLMGSDAIAQPSINGFDVEKIVVIIGSGSASRNQRDIGRIFILANTGASILSAEDLGFTYLELGAVSTLTFCLWRTR